MNFLSLATSDILFTCRGLSLPRMGTRAFPTNFLCKKYHQKWRSEIRDQRWRWQRAINCLYAVYSARALPSNILCKKYRFPDLGKIICPKDKEELSCLSGKRNSGVDDMTLCQYNSYHFPLFRILWWRLLFYPFSIFLFLLYIFSTKM